MSISSVGDGEEVGLFDGGGVCERAAAVGGCIGMSTRIKLVVAMVLGLFSVGVLGGTGGGLLVNVCH